MSRYTSVLFLLMVSVLLPASPAATQTPEPVRVQWTRMVGKPGGAQVLILVSDRFAWSESYRESGDLVLRIENSVPGPVLKDLESVSGLIASVTATRGEDNPIHTEITIRSREQAIYSIVQHGSLLLVDARGEDAGSVEAPVTSPRTSEPARAPELAGPPVATARDPGPDAADDFRLGPGDVLQIDVFGLEEFDRKVRVLRDGTISLPLLGNFQVTDRTVQQTSEMIAAMLAERRLVNDPQVSIFVEEFVNRTVSVQGAVQNPGVYPLKGRNTLLDLLGEAGGLAEKRGSRIVVLRGKEGEPPENIEIDAERLIDEGDYSLNIPLRAGDIVMVPQARQFRVYVTGAVENPGPVDYLSSEGITVLQAVTAAGGPTERTNLRKVHIIRKLPGGSQERIKVNIKKIQAGKAEDVVLERNDTVVVGEWFL